MWCKCIDTRARVSTRQRFPAPPGHDPGAPVLLGLLYSYRIHEDAPALPSDSDQSPPENPPSAGERLPPRERAPAPPRRPGDPAAPGGESFMRNPYILAGLATAGAIVMAVVVVVIFGSGGAANGNGGGGLGSQSPVPGRGIVSPSIATATVREGPSIEYIEVGLLRSGQDVEVVGRNQTASWFQIFYPQGSQLKGWVPSSALRVPAESELPVVAVTPIPRPTVIQPTATPEATGTTTPTPTVTGTAAPSGGPDLVAQVAQGSCVVGQNLIILVRNEGPGLLTNKPIMVSVQTPAGARIALVSPAPTSLDVGEEQLIDTGYVVTERVFAIVDPLGGLGDPNRANNRVDCVVAGGP